MIKAFSWGNTSPSWSVYNLLFYSSPSTNLCRYSCWGILLILFELKGIVLFILTGNPSEFYANYNWKRNLMRDFLIFRHFTSQRLFKIKIKPVPWLNTFRSDVSISEWHDISNGSSERPTCVSQLQWSIIMTLTLDSISRNEDLCTRSGILQHRHHSLRHATEIYRDAHQIKENFLFCSNKNPTLTLGCHSELCHSNPSVVSWRIAVILYVWVQQCWEFGNFPVLTDELCNAVTSAFM